MNAAGTKTTGVGVSYLAFLANSWDGRFEIEATPNGPRLRMGLTYWRYEGVAFGIGVDSSAGIVLYHERGYDDDYLQEWAASCSLDLIVGWKPVWDELKERFQGWAHFTRYLRND
jgi:hypothetical protein